MRRCKATEPGACRANRRASQEGTLTGGEQAQPLLMPAHSVQYLAQSGPEEAADKHASRKPLAPACTSIRPGRTCPHDLWQQQLDVVLPYGRYSPEPCSSFCMSSLSSCAGLSCFGALGLMPSACKSPAQEFRRFCNKNRRDAGAGSAPAAAAQQRAPTACVCAGSMRVPAARCRSRGGGGSKGACRGAAPAPPSSGLAPAASPWQARWRRRPHCAPRRACTKTRRAPSATCKKKGGHVSRRECNTRRRRLLAACVALPGRSYSKLTSGRANSCVARRAVQREVPRFQRS